MSCGVIRNQRSKIQCNRYMSTVRGPFRKISKIDCRLRVRVIKHARIKIDILYISLKTVIFVLGKLMEKLAY